MEFEISRASREYNADLYTKDKQPCRDAYEVDPDEFGKVWHIGIDTLEELLALIREVGTLVIKEYSIIIYDDYME
jgi:hypothetical protein